MLAPDPQRWPFVGSAFVALLVASAPVPLFGQTGAIAGIVRSAADSVPLASVRVQATGSRGETRGSARTDGSGAFRIEGLSPGRYGVVVSLPGWRTLRRENLNVRAGQVTRLTLSLRPTLFEINPLTVTGTRRAERLLNAPASVSVIDREEVERQPALTILDHVQGTVGVDVIRTGLENGFPVTRGFNDLFNASLLLLTDHRISRTPSIRANLPRILPATNLDIDQIEVVRGPASALYGPGAAEGVLHVLTKSPIDDPGFSASVGGGTREQDAVPGFDASTEGIFQAEARWAERFSQTFGAKLSGRWFRGTDWRHRDPVEESTEASADACLSSLSLENPACRPFAPAPGTLPDPALLSRIGERDFEVGHWTADARADWRPSDGTSLVLSGGLEWTENSLDLTPAGLSQTKDGITWHGQARLDAGRLFAQAYVVKNELDGPDETYFARTGQTIRDRSSLLVGQLQHGASLGSGTRLTYGLDVLHTTPVTEGVLNGIHEQDDDFTQLGAYVQSETALSDRLDLVLAARADHHSVLDGVVVSPRAGLVFEPSEGHVLRATFNRAFHTPGNTELFSDVFVQRIPLDGPFSYGVRLQGGAGSGFTFATREGRPTMKSPFAPLVGRAPTSFLPSSTEQLYRLARELLRAGGSPAAGLLDAVGVPTEDEVSPVLMRLDPGSGSFVPLAGGIDAVPELPPLEEQTTNTLEVGYKGVPAEGLLLTADVYYTRKENFLGPVRIETPNVFLDGEELVAFFRSRGVDGATARILALGTEEQPGLARIPLGVIQPRELSDPLPNLMLAARNFGDVDVFGADVAAEYRLSRWGVGLAISVVSDDHFDAGGLDVALNAPTLKSRISVTYRDGEDGPFARLAHRFVNGFPASSGVFTGRVDDYQLLDLTLGWSPPGLEETTLQLDVDNLLDEGYRAFPGAPELGRVMMGRVVYGL